MKAQLLPTGYPEMDGGFVQPQFQIPNSNSYFENSGCNLLHGARIAATTQQPVIDGKGKKQSPWDGTPQ